MKRFRRSILFATGLFVLDAYFLNQGVIALFVMLLALFIFLPWSLWTLRRDKRLFVERMTRTGIYLLAMHGRIRDQQPAEPNGGSEGDCVGGTPCLAYRAKYQHYPQRLQELVPEFLPSVPVAKLCAERILFLIPGHQAEASPCSTTRNCRRLAAASTTWKPAAGDTWIECHSAIAGWP